MVPEAKQPPAYKLATLPAGESVTWRFTVRITGFGRVSVQPFISVPAQISLDPGLALLEIPNPRSRPPCPAPPGGGGGVYI